MAKKSAVSSCDRRDSPARHRSSAQECMHRVALEEVLSTTILEYSLLGQVMHACYGMRITLLERVMLAGQGGAT